MPLLLLPIHLATCYSLPGTTWILDPGGWIQHIGFGVWVLDPGARTSIGFRAWPFSPAPPCLDLGRG